MWLKVGGAALLLVVVIAGLSVFNWRQGIDEFVEAPRIQIKTEVPGIDVELNQRFISRLIAEDEDIQAALSGPQIRVASGEAGETQTVEGKSSEDILFELMAPWVYIGYRKINDRREGQFLNTKTERKTGWLGVGRILNGAEIVGMDMEKAVVTYADATQELLYVPEKLPPYDPSVPRTPEQVALAQRYYKEHYMKKFIVQGKKYDELRGRKSIMVPSRREQLESGEEYLTQFAPAFAENSAGSGPPPEALIDSSQLSDKHKKLHDQYLRLFNRNPADINQALEGELNQIRQELNTMNQIEFQDYESSVDGSSASGNQISN